MVLAWLVAVAAAIPDTDLLAQKLLDDAAVSAFRSRNPQERALCLAEIAAAWAPLDRGKYESIAAQAVEQAKVAQSGLARALALRGVAVRVGKVEVKRAAQVLEEAAGLARSLHSVDRMVALRELALAAESLRLETARSMTTEALDAIRKTEYPMVRAGGLRDLAAGLHAHAPELSQQVFVEAEETLEAAPQDHPGLDLARADLAMAWAPYGFEDARRVVASIANSEVEPVALAMVAGAVAPRSSDLALVVAEQIAQGPQRAHVMAAAAAEMPVKLAPAAAALASVALDMLGDAGGEMADETRANVARALARQSPQEASDLARQIAGQEQRERAICGVAGRIGEADARAGIKLLGEVDNPLLTEDVLSRLAIGLARAAPEEAAGLARQLRSQRLRVETYVGIVGVLRKQGDE